MLLRSWHTKLHPTLQHTLQQNPKTTIISQAGHYVTITACCCLLQLLAMQLCGLTCGLTDCGCLDCGREVLHVWPCALLLSHAASQSFASPSRERESCAAPVPTFLGICVIASFCWSRQPCCLVSMVAAKACRDFDDLALLVVVAYVLVTASKLKNSINPSLRICRQLKWI